MAIKSCFSCTRRVDLEVDAEMLVCELGTGGRHCLVFSLFYRPPQSGEDFLVCFESFLDKFAATGVSNLIIAGDFNFPHINWSTGSPIITDNLTESFCNILDDHFLTQMNFHVTRMSSSSFITGYILDLVFTNFESLVEDVVVFPHAFESDHFPITFTPKRKFHRQKNVKRVVYSYNNADLEGLRETWNRIPWAICDLF